MITLNRVVNISKDCAKVSLLIIFPKTQKIHSFILLLVLLSLLLLLLLLF